MGWQTQGAGDRALEALASTLTRSQPVSSLLGCGYTEEEHAGIGKCPDGSST
jgi:hypothetical protein